MVILIVGAVLAVLLPALARGREKGMRIACLNNARQLALGSVLYAEEDPDGNYVGRMSTTNDLNWLFSKLVTEPRVYTCPSTGNQVRREMTVGARQGQMLTDLLDTAPDVGSPGASYRVLASFGRPGTTTGKVQSTVVSYAHQRDAFGMRGWVPGPSQVWLYADSDKRRPGLRGSLPNWPDRYDNHGTAGGNVSFCDGHAEFVRQRDYFYRYELSQDEGYLRPSER